MPELIRPARDGRGVEPTTAGVLLIAVLAWAAGAVNACGYLALDQIFTSHMTGNTSAVLLALVAGRGRHPARRALALAAFFGGAAAGALLVERHHEHNSAGALSLEAAVLIGVAVFAWTGLQHGLVVDLELVGIAAAMGIQNIALAGTPLSAHTTHITGPLTDFAGTLVRRIVGRREVARDRSHGLAVYGGRALAFAIGIASGAAVFRGTGIQALLLPAVVVALAAAAVRAGLQEHAS